MLIKLGDEVLSVKDWALKLGITRAAIYYRIKTFDETIEQAITHFISGVKGKRKSDLNEVCDVMKAYPVAEATEGHGVTVLHLDVMANKILHCHNSIVAKKNATIVNLRSGIEELVRNFLCQRDCDHCSANGSCTAIKYWKLIDNSKERLNGRIHDDGSLGKN